MDKACAKIFVHEDPTGSSIHSCFIKKCKRRPTVFLRTVREESKEEWIPTCRVHTSQVAGLVGGGLAGDEERRRPQSAAAVRWRRRRPMT